MTKKFDIIIVDSNPSMIDDITSLLGNNHFSISSFTNSKDALEFIIKHPPKIVFIDYNTQEISASDFIVKMSQSYLFQYTSACLLSEAPIDEFKKMQLMTLGFSKIFRKPINATELKMIVEEICTPYANEKIAA